MNPFCMRPFREQRRDCDLDLKIRKTLKTIWLGLEQLTQLLRQKVEQTKHCRDVRRFVV